MTGGYADVLRLRDVSWSGPDVTIDWSVDALRFTTSYRYADVDLDELVAAYGLPVVEAVLFHLAMFEVNKGLSFGPARLEIDGRWRDHLTAELYELWRTVGHQVWAQWRYEHDRPDYRVPVPDWPLPPAVPLGVALPASEVGALWFCGGGKDSLLAGHLLERAGTAFDALGYAHSGYGAAPPQLALIDRVAAGTPARARREIRITDSATDAPAGGGWAPYPMVRYVLAAETPSSLFAALPLVLRHGYRQLILAHERSANTGNVVWHGEEVNHQWGKSLAAETLLDDYVRRTLVPGLRYFSILQPVHDAVIFAALRDVAARVPAAHSCNVAKPWCRRCAKCAYVWICYRAWLPWEAVDAAFGPENLLDVAEDEPWFREMLGLAEHTPFECVGEAGEARLAFALARARGLTGAAMALLDDLPPLDVAGALDRYLAVDASDHRIPEPLAGPVVAHFERAAVSARRYAEELLPPGGTVYGGQSHQRWS